MENRKVLDVLEEHGDTLEVVREVMHWVYFTSRVDRENYKKEVMKLGYSIDVECWTGTKGREYCLRFKRDQSVTVDEIDQAVVELFQLARRHNGDYDGWETQVDRDKPDRVQ